MPNGKSAYIKAGTKKQTPVAGKLIAPKKEGLLAATMAKPAAIPGTEPVPPGAMGQAQDMQLPATEIPPTEPPATTPVAPVSEAATPTMESLLGQFEEQGAEARKATEERYKQGMSLYDQMVAMYEPGGGFGQGAMADYRRTKTRSLAQARQGLVSSGLYGTSVSAGLEPRYEEEVGTPFRLQLADVQAQRFAEALGQKAGFIERREDVPPDPALMAELAMRAEAAPGGADLGGGAGVGAGAGAGVGAGIPAGGIYASGMTGPISRGEYAAETQRRQLSTAHAARAEQLGTALESYKSVLQQIKDRPEYAGQEQHIEQYNTVIKTLEAQQTEAQKNVEKYGETAAKISRQQYAEYDVAERDYMRKAQEQEAAARRAIETDLVSRTASMPKSMGRMFGGGTSSMRARYGL